MKDFQDTISLKIGSEELIKNIELRNLIKYKLNKDDFTAEELEDVDEIILDSKNIVGDYNTVYFEELDFFPNLERISIRNLGISNQNITKLKNIKQIEFINCELEELEGLENVQCLKLINSEVDTIEAIGKLTEITELHLINMKFENFDMLKTFKSLNKELSIFSLQKPNPRYFSLLGGVIFVFVVFTFNPSFFSIQFVMEYITLVEAALLFNTISTSSAYRVNRCPLLSSSLSNSFSIMLLNNCDKFPPLWRSYFC